MFDLKKNQPAELKDNDMEKVTGGVQVNNKEEETAIKNTNKGK